MRSRDVETALDVCDPEVEWHTLWPGLEPVYRGHEGIRQWAESFEEAITDAGQEVHEAVETGESVFLHVRLYGRGRGSGTPVEMTIFDVWTFRDGKLIRRRPFYERAEAEAAAGLPLSSSR
jgi:ketosteroid isomerase-like protein